MIAAQRLLGLPTSGPIPSIEEVRRAYRAACIRWHPDKNPHAREAAERKFKEVQSAFFHLSRLAAGGEDAAQAAAEDVLSAAEGFSARLDALDLEEAASAAPAADGDGLRGQTKLRIGEGILYVGAVVDGQPHGGGTLVLRDGSVHRGGFKAGRADGRGIFFAAGGAVFKGSWEGNKRTGLFEVVDSHGRRWHEEYAGGQRLRREKVSVLEAVEAAEAAAAAAAAEAAEIAEAAAEAVRAAQPVRPVALTVTRAQAAMARGEAAAAAVGPHAASSPAPGDPYSRMTPAQRRAAAERRRLAGAAARAERTRIEGGGFAGVAVASSPQSGAAVGSPDEIEISSLFERLRGREDAAPSAQATPAALCQRCGAKFHTRLNLGCCRYHNSEWMEYVHACSTRPCTPHALSRRPHCVPAPLLTRLLDSTPCLRRGCAQGAAALRPRRIPGGGHVALLWQAQQGGPTRGLHPQPHAPGTREARHAECRSMWAGRGRVRAAVRAAVRTAVRAAVRAAVPAAVRASAVHTAWATAARLLAWPARDTAVGLAPWQGASGGYGLLPQSGLAGSGP